MAYGNRGRTSHARGGAVHVTGRPHSRQAAMALVDGMDVVSERWTAAGPCGSDAESLSLSPERNEIGDR